MDIALQTLLVVLFNDQQFSDSAIILQVQDGDYIRVAIPSHPDDPVCDSQESDTSHSNDTMTSDDTALLQTAICWDIVQHKVTADSVVKGPDFCASPFQDEPGRPELILGEHLECIDTLRSIWSLHAAAEIVEEGRVLSVSTWFSDAERWPLCETSRPVRLTSDTSTWIDRLAEAWDDRVDPDLPVHLYLITPQPRRILGDRVCRLMC